MDRIITTGLLGILALGVALAADRSLSLDSIQGAWWSSCQDPAAEFVVDGDEYSGDFLGTHKLELSGDVLAFKSGLADGHSIDLSHTPLFFRVVSTGQGQLVLRGLSEVDGSKDWHLQACSGIPAGGWSKPQSLREAAPIQVLGAVN